MRLSTLKWVSALAAGVAVFTGTSATHAAGPLNFNFSFTATTGTTGTVTGEILGLTDNSTGSATAVDLLTYPAGLTNTAGSGPFVFGTGPTPFNSFTVAGGQLTAADYLGQTGTGNAAQLELNAFGANAIALSATSAGASNSQGFAGVTYSPVAVPEPTSLSLLGLGATALLRRRSRRGAGPLTI